jgi:hypothetical protein
MLPAATQGLLGSTHWIQGRRVAVSIKVGTLPIGSKI